MSAAAEPANLDQSELLPVKAIHKDAENQESIVKGQQEHINASMCQMDGARMHKQVTSHFHMWFLYAVFHVNHHSECMYHHKEDLVSESILGMVGSPLF